MSRTSITTGKTHAGEDVLISGRSVPIVEQLAAFRKLRGQPAHDRFCLVALQESDGAEQIIRFLTPEEHAERKKRRESEMAALRQQAPKYLLKQEPQKPAASPPPRKK